MALHPPQNNSKMIFAPTSSPSTTQADQFNKGTLQLSDLSPSPITQFHTWFSACSKPSPPTTTTAITTPSTSPLVPHPETCCLSTASLPSGRVSSRYVYLKELTEQGFVIYSNWGTSKKARDFEGNKWVSLAFWWEQMERQVRVEGIGERMSREEGQVYFDTRGRGSRVGAWSSRQSQRIDDDREELDKWVAEREKQFEGQDKIPIPEFWGGLRIRPVEIEFWQGRDSRLHDRFVYKRVGGVDSLKEEGEGEWTIERLSP